MTTVKAQLMNTRLAPRKVRLIVNLVRGKNALLAMDQLAFVVRRPADPVAKLIKSAIANATNNFNMVASNLYIKEFYVDEGVKLKRYRPKAMGAVGEIQKKTSHIHLTLAEKVPGLKAEKSAKKEVAHTHEHHDNEENDQPKMKADNKPEIKTDLGKKTVEPKKGLRKMFQRKSI